MNVLWQDNLPSFLDASGLGAGSFAGSLGAGGAPWFASNDGGLFSGQPVLWWDNGADSAAADSGLAGVAGFDPGGAAGGWLTHGAEAFAGTNPTLGAGLLWPGSDLSGAAINDGGSGPASLTNGVAGASATPFDTSPAFTLWKQFINELSPTAFDTWMTDISGLLWNGTGQSQVTLPLTPPITGNPPTHLLAADGLPASSLATLTPQHLVWTDSSQVLPGIISDLAAVVAVPTTFGGVGIVGPSSGSLTFGGLGSR
jgi:hypothetical protein